MSEKKSEPISEREAAIQARVAAGLSRKQAEEVQNSQEAWDKQQADEAKKAAKKA